MANPTLENELAAANEEIGNLHKQIHKLCCENRELELRLEAISVSTDKALSAFKKVEKLMHDFQEELTRRGT